MIEVLVSALLALLLLWILLKIALFLLGVVLAGGLLAVGGSYMALVLAIERLTASAPARWLAAFYARHRRALWLAYCVVAAIACIAHEILRPL